MIYFDEAIESKDGDHLASTVYNHIGVDTIAQVSK